MKRITNKSIVNHQSGFTLVETLVAIFILVVAVTALMTVAKNDFYVVRYARNQMIATTLMQEGIEFVRADRDTAFQNSDTAWSSWVKEYADGGCFTGNGCAVDPYATTKNIMPCGKTCPNIVYFPTSVFYAYDGDLSDSDKYATDFIRTITFATSPTDPNQVTATSTISWRNGNSAVSQSQSTLITNWMTPQ